MSNWKQISVKDDISKYESNDNVTVVKCKNKRVMKSGEIKIYEYNYLYTKKSNPKPRKLNEIFEKILENYSELIFSHEGIYKIATDIYTKLSDEDKKNTNIKKIQSFIYRERYKKEEKKLNEEII